MPNCHTIDPLVTPYIDGELAEGDRRVVDDHLRRCPPCHSRVVAERAVRDLIHARKPLIDTAQAPASLRPRCCAARLTAGATTAVAGPGVGSRARGFSRAFGPSWRAHLGSFAVAASLMLVVGGAFVYQLTASSARVMAAELTADHLKCFAMNAALGTHEPPAAVESAMASGFGWQMRLPREPARAGLDLVGARPCFYGEGKVAHIMYRHEGRPVSLFMLPRTARAQELVEVLGHGAAIWCVGDRTFVLITREPRQQVQQLASFVQTSLR
jgi:anti-sigma factor RsiW